MNGKKEVTAVSKATYRGVDITATATGFVFFWNGRRYENTSLSEATAAIDAIYARLVNVISPAGIVK